jgi:dienelactone hydrolase
MNTEDFTKRRVLYELPRMDAVVAQQDDAIGGEVVMDIYRPLDSRPGDRHPAVILVAGYPDPGFEKRVGCRFKEMGSSTSWARLFAASGMVGITYANREPARDLHAVLAHLGKSAASLGVDEKRIGVWASSGNGPLALSLLIRNSAPDIACAVLCYPYTLDAEEASRSFGFANPCAGKTGGDLRTDVPLFIARAGQDSMPRLNDTLDGFLREAIANNLPLTLVNHPSGPHAFDLFDDSEATRGTVRAILAFLAGRLSADRARSC